MRYELGTDGQRRLEDYFAQIGEILGNDARWASFAAYAIGRMSELERKSVEPIAKMAYNDPVHAGAGHERLHHFVSVAKWDDRAVRLAAARYAIQLGVRSPRRFGAGPPVKKMDVGA